MAQVMPSEEVTISPVLTTPTRRLPEKASPLISLVVGETREVQAMPFGEVRMVPCRPPATNWLPAQITATRSSLVGAG